MHATVLRYFQEVAECGSIRRAAAVLHVASSAVNRQILKLEQDLGVQLFERSSTGVQLTSAGELLMRHVADTLNDYGRVRAEIDGLRGQKTGLVRVAALVGIMSDFLPRTVVSFQGDYPAVDFQLTSAGPERIVDELASGRADIGVNFTDVGSGGFVLLADAAAPQGAIVPSGHRLARRRKIALTELAGEQVVLWSEPGPLWPYLTAALKAHNVRAATRAQTNSLDAMKRLVAAGTGVGLFSRFGFEREIAAGDIVHVPFKEPFLADRRIGVFVPANRRLAPGATLFVDHLGKAFGKL